MIESDMLVVQCISMRPERTTETGTGESLCLSIPFFFSLSLYIYMYISVYLSVYLSAYLSVYLSIYIFIYISTLSLSTLSVYLSPKLNKQAIEQTRQIGKYHLTSPPFTPSSHPTNKPNDQCINELDGRLVP